MSNDPFADIRDKRIGELNEEQVDRSFELWARENIDYQRPGTREALLHIFSVIDRLRAPIDMVLHCPSCGMQHIDEAESPGIIGETCDDGGTCHHGCKVECFRRKGCVPLSASGMTEHWQNPPHRSHLCHGCGHIWRPADVPTNGVAAVKTKGKNDLLAVPTALPGDTMDWPLPCDVKVGHGTMRKGVSLRTLVTRMKVLYELATGLNADEVAKQNKDGRA